MFVVVKKNWNSSKSKRCVENCIYRLKGNIVRISYLWMSCSWKSYRNGKPESSVICQYVCQSVLFVRPINKELYLVS